MDRVIRQVSEWVGTRSSSWSAINCHHSFTESELHYGKRVRVSLKGAIQADAVGRGSSPGRWARPRTWWRGSANRCR